VLFRECVWADVGWGRACPVGDVLLGIDKAMRRRLTTRLLILLHRVVRHPLLVSTTLFVVVSLGLAFEIHLAERDQGPPYDTFSSTLKGIIPVLIISGMDVPQPQTLAGLLCSYLLMILGVVYIAVLTAAITTEFVIYRLGWGLTMGKVKFEKHILICGWMDRSREVLNQLFAPDLADPRPVVIIDPQIKAPPLDHPLLKAVQGDPTDWTVLEQANARHAKSAIILADRQAGDPNAADARSLLIALAVETLQPDVYSCVEVLNPDNVVHFERANVDEVISVSEISNRLVVQAALSPGVSKVIVDMLTFGEGEEVYKVPVPEAFVGSTFAELAGVLMSERGIVLIGVLSGGEVIRSERCRWTFKPQDAVFVLAEDQPTGLEELRRTA